MGWGEGEGVVGGEGGQLPDIMGHPDYVVDAGCVTHACCQPAVPRATRPSGAAERESSYWHTGAHPMHIRVTRQAMPHAATPPHFTSAAACLLVLLEPGVCQLAA